MAGKKGNKAHANKTSFPNQKTNAKEPKVILRKLKEVLENAIEDETITSWQGAVRSIGWRVTKMDYWTDKIPAFGIYKKEIKQILICRVDSKALNNKFNATQSIWRQKQLGERDEKFQDVKTNGKEISIPAVSWVKNE